jgi:hypothetical protein
VKVRILYFMTSEVRGGIEEHVLSLIKGLDRGLIETYLAWKGDKVEIYIM